MLRAACGQMQYRKALGTVPSAWVLPVQQQLPPLLRVPAVLGGGRCPAGRRGSGAGGGSGSRSSVAGVSRGTGERGETLPTRSPLPSSAHLPGSLPSPQRGWRANFFCRCLTSQQGQCPALPLSSPQTTGAPGRRRDEGGRVVGQLSLGLGTEL